VIAIVDYGMGNLRSMAKALEYVGGDALLTSDAADIRRADRIVLPGVGAFGEAMENLHSTGLVDVLAEEVLQGGKPFLGVCLGMQLLARTSVEHGRHEGLGWLAADVLPLTITASDVRVPHTGWNDIELQIAAGTALSRVRPGTAFYFNHSFHLVPDDRSVIAAHTVHGHEIVAAIAQDNICATQFHPEKSQQAGLELLADFVAWTPASARAAA